MINFQVCSTFQVCSLTTLQITSFSSTAVAVPIRWQGWSMVARRLGDPKQAIKFGARWHLFATSTLPGNPSPNFLRERLIPQLAKGDAGFFKKLRSQFPSRGVRHLSAISCEKENLSCAPWHALPQHRPLGAVNRGYPTCRPHYLSQTHG
jgi:hypothetical protein